YGTVGEVMNLAARLMQAAPGRILCDGATYRAARSHLAFQDLPAISVKGKAEPVTVYQPVEPTRRTGSPPAMLGRVEERAVLIERLRALEDGRSGLVVIDGEPGIGKWRLLADPLDLPDNELTAQLTGEVRADNTGDLLVRFFQAAAAAPDGSISPLLVVLDDAHWFDSASWALARQVVAHVRPLLLVLATRPLVE